MTMTTMMNFLILLMISLMMTLPMPSSAVPMGILIFITATTTMTLLTILTASWSAAVMFLIYIGGLMVMFAYFLAIQPNQPLSMMFMTTSLTINMIILTSISHFNTPLLYQLNFPDISFMLFATNTPLLLIMGLILILILIVVVKMTTSTKSPLRPFKP